MAVIVSARCGKDKRALDSLTMKTQRIQKIDAALLDELLVKAACSPRLRAILRLRVCARFCGCTTATGSIVIACSTR